MEVLSIENQIVKQNEAGLISLTDIWRASGLSEAKKPAKWHEHFGKPFIQELSLKVGNPPFKLWQSKRGKYHA